MESFDISVEKRNDTGKSAMRKLKNEGMVPGIIYNQGAGIPIILEEHELRNILDKKGEGIILNFELNGTKVSAKVKEVQRDPINQDIQHIDLMPLDGGILH
ncbi:MAG: 50S ribosomal protein L25 [Clostridia bacterium]|nr:50S ribosomal protein L25 [Clostridia bacterium]